MPPASAKTSSSVALLRDELRTLFRDLNEIPGLGRPGSRPPAVDVIDTPEAVEIRIDLMELAPDKLSVHIDGDSLAIKGARRIQAEEKAGHSRVQDDRVRHFARSIQLPGDIRPADLKARYRHGLLEIVLVKEERLA